MNATASLGASECVFLHRGIKSSFLHYQRHHQLDRDQPFLTLKLPNKLLVVVQSPLRAFPQFPYTTNAEKNATPKLLVHQYQQILPTDSDALPPHSRISSGSWTLDNINFVAFLSHQFLPRTAPHRRDLVNLASIGSCDRPIHPDMSYPCQPMVHATSGFSSSGRLRSYRFDHHGHWSFTRIVALLLRAPEQFWPPY